MISAAEVKVLRDQTGAGVVEVKKALEEAAGDVDKATKILQKRGQASAAKKADRTMKEGIVATYVHPNGKLAASVALACETDFVARTDDFKNLAKDIAMQVAAMNPRCLAPENAPKADLAERTEEAKASAKGKPAAVVEKIVQGKLDKWYQEICLLEQPFIKEDTRRVKDLITDAVAKLGENIAVTDFARIAI